MVTSNRFCDDIVASSVLNNGREVNVDVDASVKLSKKGLTLAECDSTNWNIGLGRILKKLQRVALECALTVVPGYNTKSALRSSKLDLYTERANSTIDKSNLAF